MANTPEAFLRQAIALAVENVLLGRGGPFGALVVKDGTIIATGVNLVTATNDPTAHAEVVAIRAACKILSAFQLSGCEVYTSCEPCPMCLGAIYWARPNCFYLPPAVKKPRQRISTILLFTTNFTIKPLALHFRPSSLRKCRPRALRSLAELAGEDSILSSQCRQRAR